jgi:GNAT superfamily N-acetyltransferase
LIREATAADAKRIAELGAQFYGAAGLDRMMGEYDPQSVEHLICATEMADDAVTMVAEVGGQIAGFAAAVIANHPLKHSALFGQELFWWVEPEHRKSGVGNALMSALEYWAKSNGAQSFIMVTLHGLSHDAVSEMYAKSGYTRLEYSFVKRV